MEQWKLSILIGVVLIVLTILFAILRKTFSIWIILILILAIVNIALGFLRKMKEN